MTGDIGKKMYVVKRDGRQEEVSFDKVLHRIQKLAVGLEHVNPALVAQKVCSQIQDGIKTSELDEFAGETAAMMVGRAHPNYGKLAARIVIDNHHKNTPATFQECAETLCAQGIVSQKICEVSRMQGIQEMIDYERDFELFDYFGFKTLEKSYLQKIDGKVVERPQHMWMRVAIEIHTDEYATEHFGYPIQYIPNMRRIAETYDALSHGYFIHATPTLFNAGTNHTQLSSCFVAGTLVHTMNGVKPIETVEIGDEVVTHAGNVKKVKQLHTNLLGDRTLYDIKMAGTPSMTVTGNHRLWSLSDEQERWNQTPTWNRVDYLRTGDWVAIPNNKTTTETYILDTKPMLDTIVGDGDSIQYSYEFIDDKVYPTYHYTSHHETEVRNHSKKGEPFNRYWTFNNETMELMGIWYGDGSITHAKNSSRNMVPRNVNIVSHDTNTVLIDFVKDAFVNMLGVTHITVSKDQHHMVSIVVNNTIVAALFKKIFKCKFDGKRIPTFFNRLSYENIKYFIAGLVSSDGCVSKTNSISIQLTNPPLVNDIFYLARSVGIPLTVTFMGGTDIKKATGRMSVPGELVNGLVKKYYEDDRLDSMSDVPWKQFRIIGGTTFVRINNKTVSDVRPPFVYTFGVEDDHSYSVGGIIAENCFLLDFKADSIKGIYETLGDCAQISKWAGGVGLAVHKIRAKNSRIAGTNGQSTGIVPMLKVYNDTARYVNQGGKRNGSFAVYLEPWHADIEDFLRLKLNTGAEEDRARDLFYGLWIPDEFMRRVKEGKDWTLMCPHECPGLPDSSGEKFDALYLKYEAEGKGRKTVPAQKIWQMILDAQIQTGTPYLCYKDAGNSKSNQKHLGTIKSSNLCVAPETIILTDNGQFPIAELSGKNVRVWNGDQFSEVIVSQTGIDQELVNVELSDGRIITCTPYHKFIISEGYWDKKTIEAAVRVDASDLKPGMKLRKTALPTLAGNPVYDIKYAYTHGFYCGDGTYSNGSPRITLYGEKKALVPHFDIKSMSGVETASGTLNVHLHFDIEEKFKVPINASLHCRLNWLAGYLDADGGIARNGTNESIQAVSINYQFLTDIQTMLVGMGVTSKIIVAFGERKVMLPDGHGGKKEYDCKPCWRILISSSSLYHLSTLGFRTHRLSWTSRLPQRNAEQFVKVVQVISTGRRDNTYCFNEPLNHAGIFNGILTGNCSEIFEYTDPGETAVCNLGSISLTKFVEADGSYDYDALGHYTSILARNLDIVIDRNYYPTPECRASNMKHRPIGIGVQGLADVLAKMRIAWTSPEAVNVNRRIFEHIYYAALHTSYNLAVDKGSYPSFAGSPASEGLLQCDLWNSAPVSTDLDWNGLRQKVKKGLRNSLSIALMPTASTSQILGNNECFEPFTSNLYVRHVLAGDFIVINKYLIAELVDMGIWTPELRTSIIANNGSVLGVRGVPLDVQERYRTAWEIPMKTIIGMSADRAPFVCQSQSLNLFVADPSYARLSSMHIYAWEKGLKTGCYYLRTKAVASAQKFTVEPEARPDCLTCSA
jgi:ribonucleoside-diphosphate reductase alpha chain